MSDSSYQMPFGSLLIPCIIAAIGAPILLNQFGFEYNPISDGFDIANFAIDMGVFVAIAVIASFLYQSIFKVVKKEH
ncbi:MULTISPECIES: hypothetical protein [unclassified Idiomarina]|uniref:hypothetical protein n=1 Tax=unclassified Idiomarina TaxID=2614829 RepID=UPI003A7FF4D0